MSIIAECKVCAFHYDTHFGLGCPRCLNDAAIGHFDRALEDEPGFYLKRRLAEFSDGPKEPFTKYPHVLNSYGTDCAVDCPACAEVSDRKQARPAIDELERMFKLEDPRL